jgi:tetratricopeptide (TPR) repeat protein
VGNSLAQFSFGVGLRLKGWKVDYAFVPGGDLGDQHRFALTIGFGLSAEDRRKAAHDLDIAMEKRIRNRSTDYLSTGNDAFAQENWTLAITNYSQALSWDPTNKQAADALKKTEDRKRKMDAQQLYDEGARLANKGEWLEAAFKWQQSLALDPSLTKANHGLAEAQTHLAASAKGSAEESYKRGVQAYMTGDYDAAIANWEKALTHSPHNPDLREYIERAKNKKLEKQMSAMKAEQQSQSGQIEAFNREAYTLYMLGKTDRAVALWEKILAISTDNADARKALKEAQAKQHLTESSSVDSTRIEELNRSAMREYSAGHAEKAADLWRQALALDPGNVWIRDNLRRIETEIAVKNLEK